MKIPSSVTGFGHEATVYAKKNGQKVLSAVTADGRKWHVMAVPGLLEAA